jgi:hypothetical protein
MKRLEPLREYLFIDEKRLDLFIDQLETPMLSPTKRTKKVGLSLAGPNIEISEENNRGKLNVHEKIEHLVRALRNRGLLRDKRPQDDHSRAGTFVLETMRARKVVIPNAHLKATPGIKHLAVWISDPDPSVFSSEPWVWRGSFLYLTELWLDSQDEGQMWSGRSALQAIANLADGRELLENAKMESWEPLGRGSYDHPVEKLRKCGALVGDQRQIMSLYKIRYSSNEQCYRWEAEERRVNDVLGYPLFIAELIGA